MTDYLPLILSLISALLGIRGYTWDDDKKGVRRITIFGKIIIGVSILSFIFSLYTIHLKNEQISDTKNIRKIADTQVRLGINYLLTPLIFDSVMNKDSIIDFNKLKDTSHLSKLFKKSILKDYPNLGLPTEYDNPYQFDSARIQKGEDFLNDALIKYNSFLEAKSIIDINNVLRDNFFNDKYKFRNSYYFINASTGIRNDTSRNYSERQNPSYSTFDFYYSYTLEGTNKYFGLQTLIQKINILNNRIGGGRLDK